ncbi:unnamed protein product [Cunninghamella blakesleeana]
MLRRILTTNVLSKSTITPNKMALRTMATLQAQKNKTIYNDILAEREKPNSLSYFTGNYKYNDLLIELDTLYKQYVDWKPTSTTTEIIVEDNNSSNKNKADKVYSWKLRDKMSEMLAIPLKTSQWRRSLHI